MIPKRLIYLISIIGCVIFYYALKVVYLNNDELFIYGCLFGIGYIIIAAGLVSAMLKRNSSLCVALFLLISAVPFIIMSKGQVNNITVTDEEPHKFEKFELALDDAEVKIIAKGEVQFSPENEKEKLELDKKTMLIHFDDTDEVQVKRIHRIINIYYPLIDFRTKDLKNEVEKYIVILPDKDEEKLLQVFPEIKQIKR